ncbi:restriction endonuclease subunit S [Bradyrhizobium liaoningense]|uniref:restriction endonuclease subunit S n=1 Tax=Bradyrhizobium liaoningense TaxID=43992 RepID=UPI001BA703F2|nr:restriction endonuclease subunit S [Bradyrhizobium liaoningense]
MPNLSYQATFGGFTSVLRVDPRRAEPRYVYHWFSTERTQQRARSFGQRTTNISNLNQSRCLELEVPLPPLNEQRRIAAILDKADALRRKREQAISLIRAASDSFIEVSIERFAGRKMQSLGGCLEFITTGGRNWSQYYVETGSRFIRSLDVQMNSVSDEDVVFVDAPDNAEAKRTRTRAGDVLLTVTGSRIGRVAALPQELAGAYISQHVAILRPNARRLRPKFLSYFLSSQSGQRQIAKWQYGQTKPGLNFKQIEAFEIPEIGADKQLVIERAIASFEHSVRILRVQRAKFDDLFSSLQHRAFSGQL